MIITTTDGVPGREIAKILGVVNDAQTAWVSGKSAQDKIIRSLTRQAEALGARAQLGHFAMGTTECYSCVDCLKHFGNVVVG
jgi:uncharacterized protein YbjQ (UPF0145 family)